MSNLVLPTTESLELLYHQATALEKITATHHLSYNQQKSIEALLRGIYQETKAACTVVASWSEQVPLDVLHDVHTKGRAIYDIVKKAGVWAHMAEPQEETSLQEIRNKIQQRNTTH